MNIANYRKLDIQRTAIASSEVLRIGGNPENYRSIDEYFTKMMQTDLGAALMSMFLDASPLPKTESPKKALEAFATSVAPEYYFQALWARYGYNIFRLSDSLMSTFLLTDPGEVSELVFPFPAFVIGIPRGFLRIDDENSKDSDVAYIYITKYRLQGGINHYWFSAYAETGVRLWMTRTMDNILEPLSDEAETPKVFEFDQDVTDNDRWTRRCILRVCINFLLWLDAKGGVKKLEKPFESKKRKNGGVWPTTWMLHTGSKLSRELLTAAKDFGKEPNARVKEWKLLHRHIVRGHSKLQPCGEGRKERKRVIIEPYFRGPEGEEAWAKVYST